MHVINFAHPLTQHQCEQLELLCGKRIDQVIDVRVHVSHDEALGPQAIGIVNTASLTNQQWQTLPLAIVPPSLSPVACACMAEIHGRCGYFPAIVRLRPRPDSVPPIFDVEEIVNLQHIREKAREDR